MNSTGENNDVTTRIREADHALSGASRLVGSPPALRYGFDNRLAGKAQLPSLVVGMMGGKRSAFSAKTISTGRSHQAAALWYSTSSGSHSLLNPGGNNS